MKTYRFSNRNGLTLTIEAPTYSKALEMVGPFWRLETITK